MVKVWKGRVIKKLDGGPLDLLEDKKENTWASFTLLLKTLKQENQHNPTILQACLGLSKTCGTMAFKSSCVLVGDGECGDRHAALYRFTDPHLYLETNNPQVVVLSSHYCVLATFLLVLSEIGLLNSAMKFRWERRRRISWVVFL